MKTIPSCFFPTTVLFIDDEPTFLKSLRIELTWSMLTCRLYDNPNDAISYLNEEYQIDPFTKRWVQLPDAEDFEHRSVDVNIQDLYREVYNPERFGQVSAVVVDYNMPGLDGVTFCNQIKDPHVQKILLTGEADEHIAVDAFNKGFIDHYLRKQDRDLSGLLKKAITQAQYRYFLSISKIVTESILNNSSESSALKDPVFVKFFLDYVKEKKVAEFYLFESMGSFLLLDGKGNSSSLFLKNRDQMEAVYLEAKDEEELSSSFKETVKQYKKIFCYQMWGDAPFPPPSEWEEHFKKAYELKGQESYYYAFTSDMPIIDKDKYLPFRQYKEQAEGVLLTAMVT